MKDKIPQYLLAIILGSLAFFLAFTSAGMAELAGSLLAWILIFVLVSRQADAGTRRKFHLIGGLEIAVFCLFLAYRNTNAREILDALEGVNYFYLTLSLVFIFLSMLFRATRWYYILLPTKKISIHSLFSSIMIGFMGNCVLPMRIGEFLRAYSISRKENIKLTTSIATIVLERIIDGLMVITMLLILVFICPIEEVEARMDIPIRHIGYIVSLVYAVAIAFLVLLRLKAGAFIRITRSLIAKISEGLAEKVAHLLDSFLLGLSSLKSPSQLLQIGLHSILVWGAILGMYVTVIKAFSIQIPFYGYLLLQIFVVIGVLIPTPGFIGPFHYFFKLALTKGFSINPSLAGACAIIAHALGFVPTVIIGLVYFLREHLSLKEVEKASEEPDKLMSEAI